MKITKKGKIYKVNNKGYLWYSRDVKVAIVKSVETKKK